MQDTRMSEVLDATPTYILALSTLLLVAAAVGFTASGTLSLFGSILLAAVLGFLGGMYASREEAEWVGSFLLTAALTGVVLSFLPLDVTRGLVVFLAGFVAGMRTERH